MEFVFSIVNNERGDNKKNNMYFFKYIMVKIFFFFVVDCIIKYFIDVECY